MKLTIGGENQNGLAGFGLFNVDKETIEEIILF